MEYIQTFFDTYGMAAAIFFLAIENVGVPLPIEFVYIYGQDLLASGRYSFLTLLSIFTFAHMVGALFSYFLGLAGNTLVSNRMKKNKKASKVRVKIEHWYKKYGSITNFFVRLIGYVRPWSSFVAGFGKEKFLAFFIWTLLGTIIFNIIVMLFSGAILYLWNTYVWAKIVITCLFIFFFAGIWLLFPLLNRKKNL